MEKQVCPGCKTEYLDALPEKCTRCNYPFSGTKKEQGRFIGQQIVMKGVSKTTLAIVSGLQALFAVAVVVNLVSLFSSGTGTTDIVIRMIISAACVLVVFLIRRNPFMGVSAALITFVLYLALMGLNDPTALSRSIVIKLVFIGAMGYCLYNLKRMKDFYGSYRPDRSGLV